MSESKAEVITLEEEVTIYNADEVKQKLFEQLLNENDVTVDLSQVAEIDTAGFQALLFGKRYAEKNNLNMRIEAPSEVVSEVFGLYGMSEMVEEKS